MDFFFWLEKINDFIWAYINFILIVALGLFFAWKSNVFQLRKFSKILKIFWSFYQKEEKTAHGVPPLKAFFAAIGGCIGIGNVVGICTAIQIGGPGALFWTWIAGFLGMLLKYSEVYLGMVHRVKNGRGGYDGGPMFFLKHAFKSGAIPLVVCGLLCLYGVEVYQFNVVVDTLSTNWFVNKWILVPLLIVFIFIAVSGGIKRVGKICSKVMPLFLILYVLMSLWVIGLNIEKLPAAFALILKAAFTPQAAMGGFIGSSVLLTIAMGVSRGCYSGDIGIGYASVIHSESSETRPAKQASLAIIGIFLDTFVVCTLSMLLIILTGTWQSPIDASLMVQKSLSLYFPYMHLFMPFFLFLLGYSTIIAYFVVGLKCAQFLSPKKGKKIYSLYALLSFVFFSFFDSASAITVMSLAGALLLLVNLTGIYRLRHQIHFDLEEEIPLSRLEST